jgi:hypothetical protein
MWNAESMQLQRRVNEKGGRDRERESFDFN